MRCYDVEAHWDEMRDGAEPQSRTVLAHLRRCKTCQDMYAQFEGIAYCLSCLPVVEPPKTLVPKILEHLKSMRARYARLAPDRFGTMRSPLGILAVAWRDSGITFVGLAGDAEPERMRAHVERRLRRATVPADPPPWVKNAVRNFFKTWSVDTSLLDDSALTEFERAALRKASEIPPGEVRSYGWVAREIGHPQAARAVGQAMARNPVALLFPCHRVVDASGGLHNYGYGIEMKARILRMEGYRARH